MDVCQAVFDLIERRLGFNTSSLECLVNLFEGQRDFFGKITLVDNLPLATDRCDLVTQDPWQSTSLGEFERSTA